MPMSSLMPWLPLLWGTVVVLAVAGGVVRQWQLKMRVQYYVESGMTPEEAEFWARKDFGVE